MIYLTNLTCKTLTGDRGWLFLILRKGRRLRKAWNLVFFSFVILITQFSVSINAQTGSTFELKDGVLVSSDSKICYLMMPQGGIEAINLIDGSVIWKTKAADKPLALINDSLYCQIDNKTGSNELEIVILNTADQGTLLLSRKIATPTNVRATIDETLDYRFKASARPVNGRFYISWDFTRLPDHSTIIERGYGDMGDTLNRDIVRPLNMKGVIRVNLQLDQVENLQTADLPPESYPVEIAE